MNPHRYILRLALVAACLFAFPSNGAFNAQGKQPVVEGIEVVGYRRLTLAEILSHIKTRPGEPFRVDQCKRDFDALLSLGLFDKLKSRVISEAGVKGGIVVIFEVVELPLVSDIKVTNLRGVDEQTVLKRFQEGDVNLVKGGVYDPPKPVAAQRVLRELMQAHGWPNTSALVTTEFGSTVQDCSITFKVTYEE